MRIIPAYAGSTCPAASSRSPGSGSSPHTRGARCEASWKCRATADHPRIRGEHPRQRRLHHQPIRIIPAYAGSTCGLRLHRRYRTDHPRIRGEHVKMPPKLRTSFGSSPHTRGAPGSTRGSPPLSRIIPAYAGSTGLCNLGPEAEPDHPRIRGEHDFLELHPVERVGSSPHTRGARIWGGETPADRGIIPAYAGSTGERSGFRPTPRDHPRIRGEHLPKPPAKTGSVGSSPHTRGALRRPQGRDRGGRIIPAYAGSTTNSKTWTRSRWDHPRIRGEHG